MYKKCPGEKIGRISCDGCPRFRKCLFKKIRRKLKKILNKYWKISFVIMIMSLLLLLYSKVEEEPELQKDEWANTTEEVTTNKFEVITVSDKAQIVAKPNTKKKIKEQDVEELDEVTNTPKPTSTPKVTKKPNKNKTKKFKKAKNKVSSAVLKEYAAISSYELKLMEKVVYAESRGEPYKGQVAVAAVILNRYIFNKKKISIEDIVTARYQFADISNVTEDMLKQYPDCKKAVEDAINGNDPTRSEFSEGARFFYEPDSPYISEYQLKIRKGVKGVKIGGHIFHNDFKE